MLYYTSINYDEFADGGYMTDEREEAIEKADEVKAYMRQLWNAIEAAPLPEATIQALVDMLDDILYPDVEDENLSDEEAMDSVITYQDAVLAVGECFNMALYGGAE